ncbi:uncharacterized protein LOC135945726 isoform X2 [Cloeon dipterum]|uniref:uncharacterized protein LOC135945726 isoform X2 n=1 Tax=Cloeon dipterum TaxID=197152 RepID=UPI00322069BC
MSSLSFHFAKIKQTILDIDLQQNDEDIVLKLHRIWTDISQLPASIHVDIMFQKDHEDLYRKTLVVILSVHWDKILLIKKTLILTALESCASKLEKNCPVAAERCRILNRLIKEPWSNKLVEFLNSTDMTKGEETKPNPRQYPSISTDIAKYIRSEPVEVLTTRLAVLIRQKCHSLALNLVRVCVRCVGDTSPEDESLILDYYVGLLYKFKLVEEFVQEVLKNLTVEKGLALLDRYSRNETKAPSDLLKQHGMRRASKTIVNHLLSIVLQEKKVVNSEEGPVYRVTRQWLLLHKTWETPENEMLEQIGRLVQSANSTLHVYLVCKAVQSEVGFTSQLNSDMLQQIIRRMNESHNEVKNHIQTRDSLQQASESDEGPEVQEEREKLKRLVVEAEHRLAEEFVLLSLLVQHCAPAYRECLLTAFSLRPTPEGLETLESIAPPESSSENDSMLALTGDDIGCTSDVCDDLLIILSSARWQVLKWDTKWQDLKNLCIEYLKDPEKSRYKKEKLEYAKIPAYLDIKEINEDRMARRIRWEQQETDASCSSDGFYSDGEPKRKKVRIFESSEWYDMQEDTDICESTVYMVSSSGSEGEASPDPMKVPQPKYTTNVPSKGLIQMTIIGPKDYDSKASLRAQLLSLHHCGESARECAPSLAGQNLQPKVDVSSRYKSYSALMKSITSMDNFQPVPLNATVQVVQVGQGVPPPQTNTSPPVSQPPPDPPPAPQPTANGPPSNAAPTEQLPKFQQVFGKNFQQAQQQQQPQQTPLPQAAPQPPPQPPQPQTTSVQSASSATQQTVQPPSRTVTNQTNLLRMATPVQITQSSLEALIQAHPQLASALAGREGRIMCFKQGSNIILTDRLRPEVQPGTSGLKRPVKRPPEAAPAPTNNSQLENELREFDAVLRSVKERDGSSATSNNNNNNNNNGAGTNNNNGSSRPDPPPAPAPTFSQPPPLAFPKSNPAAKTAAKKQSPPAKTTAAPTPAPAPAAPAATATAAPKAAAPAKTPPKASVEDEQTQKRIYEILSEYTEQLRNSPDLNNKPAPRRRSNPPTNPSPKRKKKSKEADEHVPSEDSSSNLAQDSEEHDSISESGSSLPAESPPAPPPAAEPPPQPAPTVAIAIPVAQSKPLVLQRQLMVVGKTPGQKLFRVIPAHNSNLRALTSAPTLLLQQMCKPEQLINFQSVRSVKIPVMSSQSLSGVPVSAGQQSMAIPFAGQGIKKESQENAALIESLLQQAEAIKSEVDEHIKTEPSEEEEEDEDEEEEVAGHAACHSPVPADVKVAASARAKVSQQHQQHQPTAVVAAAAVAKCISVGGHEKKRRLVRQDNMQKSLSEECEDLGVDAPSTSELFPDADLPFELSNNSDSSVSYLDACQQQHQRRRNGAELNGRGTDEESSAAGDESPKRRKLCLTRPFAALKRRDDEAADTDGSGDEAAKAKRAVKPRSSCACCAPAAAPAPKPAKKMNGKAGKKK